MIELLFGENSKEALREKEGDTHLYEQISTFVRVRTWLLYLTILTYLYYQSVWTTVWICEIIDFVDVVWRWGVLAQVEGKTFEGFVLTRTTTAAANDENKKKVALSFGGFVACDILIRQFLIWDGAFFSAFMFFTIDMVGLRGLVTFAYLIFAFTFVVLRSFADVSWKELLPGLNLDWLIIPLHFLLGIILFQIVTFGEWSAYVTLIIYSVGVIITLALTKIIGYVSPIIFVIFSWSLFILLFFGLGSRRKYTFDHYLF
jgi:hypothetical protein